MDEIKSYHEPLTIYYCGHQDCEPDHSFGPAARGHYLMHFILKGKGCYRVGHQTFALKAGEAFLIKPHEVSFYKADSDDPWEYVWIAYGGTEAERFLEEYPLSGDQYICHWSDLSRMRTYLLAINRAYQKGQTSQEELMGWFYLIFSKLEKNENHQRPSDQDYFKKAESYIRHNYGYPIHITDIATHIGIDRTYLFRLFKKYTGTAPKQFLTDYRIEAAKNMLCYTPLNVTEIALSCGFQTSSVFCKNFCKTLGMSPLIYRKRYAPGWARSR